MDGYPNKYLLYVSTGISGSFDHDHNETRIHLGGGIKGIPLGEGADFGAYGVVYLLRTRGMLGIKTGDKDKEVINTIDSRIDVLNIFAALGSSAKSYGIFTFSLGTAKITRDIFINEYLSLASKVIDIKGRLVRTTSNKTAVFFLGGTLNAIGFRMRNYYEKKADFRGVDIGTLGLEIGSFLGPENKNISFELFIGGNSDLAIGKSRLSDSHVLTTAILHIKRPISMRIDITGGYHYYHNNRFKYNIESKSIKSTLNVDLYKKRKKKKNRIN